MKREYLQYDPVQLAAEPSFFRWVQSGYEDHHAEWAQFLLDHPEMEEKVTEAKRIVSSLGLKGMEIPVDKEVLWGRIRSSIGEGGSVRAIRGKRRIRAMWVAAAAAVVALLLAILFLFPDANRVSTEFAESRTVDLPDGSAVTLNADSRIRYEERGWKERRLVRLQGEAFFDVSEGSAFRVLTPYGSVEVLGTRFNVYARRDGFSVECLSGRVAVQMEGSGDRQVLEKGEMTVAAEHGSLVKETLHEPDRIDWMSGRSRFEDAPLHAVFGEMERQYDVRIQVPDPVQDRLYTGFFIHGDLDAALESVCWPMKLKAKVKGSKILIEEDPQGIE